ncbi:uncharacterized protein TRIREDRAFT_108188 [Trichoderma reesei QM6a]|uniref:Predicted protein n=2 Tax=Hypocrea jecorina TaxID=51453 RepID=G0RL07_HYPJQ|nr:uncharacterized protein TRIREDRAFT_108188 [Trichoderma reesei QM6a]EGR48081.1 predicted protein [Trichoderma reesei QM6a]ETS02098.1 hypothetical protein M419DRAFT_79376 [Trichoderma reesei RUT C-30]
MASLAELLVRLTGVLFVPFSLPKGYAQRTWILVSGHHSLQDKTGITSHARNAAFYRVEQHLDPCLIRSFRLLSSKPSVSAQRANWRTSRKRGVFLDSVWTSLLIAGGHG